MPVLHGSLYASVCWEMSLPPEKHTLHRDWHSFSLSSQQLIGGGGESGVGDGDGGGGSGCGGGGEGGGGVGLGGGGSGCGGGGDGEGGTRNVNGTVPEAVAEAARHVSSVIMTAPELDLARVLS